MDLRKAYGTDKALEQEGAWIDLGDGARIKVARMNNKAFASYVERRRKSARHVIDAGGDGANEIANKILNESLARHVLLDWEGFAVDGKKIVHSVEEAERVFNEFPDFRNQIVAIATDRANFRAEEIEEAGKF